MRTDIIGKRIIALRESKGLSQAELSKILGIQKSAMSYFENSSRIPKVELIDAICDHFNVSADYLLGRTDIKSSDLDLKEICEKTGFSEFFIERMIEKKEFEDRVHELNEELGIHNYSFLETFYYIVEQIDCVVYEMMNYLKAGENFCTFWDGIYEGLNNADSEEVFLNKLGENSEYEIKLDKIKDTMDLSKYRCEKEFRKIIADALFEFDIIPQHGATDHELHYRITKAIESYKYKKYCSIPNKEGDPDGIDKEEE